MFYLFGVLYFFDRRDRRYKKTEDIKVRVDTVYTEETEETEEMEETEEIEVVKW